MENGSHKRHAEDNSLVEFNQPQKRVRHELIEFEQNDKDGTVMEVEGPPRTSNLSSPIMLLTGHKADVYGCKFNPDGQTLASVGAERQIFLWNVYDDCKNYSILPGHQGSITELHYSNDGSKLYTSSTDKSVQIWDLKVGGRLKKLIGHKGIVNTCNPNRTDSRLICSGGDDYKINLYDLRQRKPSNSFTESFQILSTVFDEEGNNIIYGGIDHQIKIYDLRKNAVSIKLNGLNDSITGLSLSPNGNFVLSNSMDNLLSIWDIRPYAPSRMILSLQGHSHNFEKGLLRCAWSSDGNYVSAGSADRTVTIWNANTGEIVYKLGGHLGTVNETAFHPKEPIILSCSNDKQLYLGELEL